LRVSNPLETLNTMLESPDYFFNLDDFLPELRDIFSNPPIDPKKVVLAAVPVKNPDEHDRPIPDGMDRSSVAFASGDNCWCWEVDSLRRLFRGDKQPPVLGDFPEAYKDAFLLFDLHVLEICSLYGDRRDAEMKEIFSALRRRPDGRSLGFVHDYMWQASALILGTRPLSQAEFEAIMARLERSCRTFEQGPSSRNYAASLRMTLGQAYGDEWPD
jgi:hypothetical protein